LGREEKGWNVATYPAAFSIWEMINSTQSCRPVDSENNGTLR
jgi:hypothetical protein